MAGKGKPGPAPAAEKLCKECGFARPREDFIYGGRVRHLCREHYAEYHHKDYVKHREKRRAWHRERNKENPEAHRQRQRDIRERYRKQVLEHYGGAPPKCECCGESIYEFLALDHIEGGGCEHRRQETNGQGGLKMYRWAVKNGFPPIFRVLCHNCNMAIGFYGYCPHQRD